MFLTRLFERVSAAWVGPVLAPVALVSLSLASTAPAAPLHGPDEGNIAALAHVIPPQPPARRALDRVFSAIAIRDWQRAYALAAKSDEPLLTKIVSWTRFTLHDEPKTFDEVTDFITANPDWPLMGALRAGAEEALTDDVPAAQVVAWLTRHPPETPNGAIQFARALIETGAADRARDVVRSAWVEMNFEPDEQQELLGRFGALLRTKDDIARLDRLLWEGRDWEARRMLDRVPAARRRLATARMMLRDMKPGVDGAIHRVPDQLQDNPGLIYERLRWRRRKDFDDSAIELLQDLPETLPHPALWWRERGILARRALRDGKAALAYRLAAGHGRIDGAAYADAEFLAGWVALRFLHKPDLALTHFKKLYRAVNYPVSLARGAYWAGRAAEALGKGEEATAWYLRGSTYITTFYGQLAFARLPGPDSVLLPKDPVVTAAEAQAYARRDVVRAAKLIALSHDRNHLKWFVRHLVRTAKSPQERALAADIAVAAGRHDIAVRAAKYSLRYGVYLIRSGWPETVLPAERYGIDRDILFAIMRQESGFDSQAVSWAGARGLMQLMPATAEQVAGRLGLPFSRERLLADPFYNMTLGTRYFSHIAERFGGSYVLMLAAYNAGPSRAERWLEKFGDFRHGEIDPIDWIELIPFEQTRDYIERIMGNLEVYRALANGRRLTGTLDSDLRR